MASKNTIDILSLRASFDQKSIREQSESFARAIEDAVTSSKIEDSVAEKFAKVNKMLNGKFKNVNFSKYYIGALDALVDGSEDASQKILDLVKVVEKLDDASKTLKIGSNVFSGFSAREIESVINQTEELTKKYEKLKDAERKYNSEGQRVRKRKISFIEKDYLARAKSGGIETNQIDEKYINRLLSNKKNTGGVKLDDAQKESIQNLTKLINLYSVMEKIKPEKGTKEAIKYEQDLYEVSKQINVEREKLGKTNDELFKALSNGKEFDLDGNALNKARQNYTKSQVANLQKAYDDYLNNVIGYIENIQEKATQKLTNVLDDAQTRISKRKGISNPNPDSNPNPNSNPNANPNPDSTPIKNTGDAAHEANDDLNKFSDSLVELQKIFGDVTKYAVDAEEAIKVINEVTKKYQNGTYNINDREKASFMYTRLDALYNEGVISDFSDKINKAIMEKILEGYLSFPNKGEKYYEIDDKIRAMTKAQYKPSNSNTQNNTGGTGGSGTGTGNTSGGTPIDSEEAKKVSETINKLDGEVDEVNNKIKELGSNTSFEELSKGISNLNNTIDTLNNGLTALQEKTEVINNIISSDNVNAENIKIISEAEIESLNNIIIKVNELKKAFDKKTNAITEEKIAMDIASTSEATAIQKITDKVAELKGIVKEISKSPIKVNIKESTTKVSPDSKSSGVDGAYNADIQPYGGLEKEYKEAKSNIDELTQALEKNEISLKDYNKSVRDIEKEYKSKINISQKRDYEDYVREGKENKKLQRNQDAINKAIDNQVDKLDLEPYKGLESEYKELINTITIFNNDLNENKLTIADYNKYVGNAIKEYDSKKATLQKRDYDEYVTKGKEKEKAQNNIDAINKAIDNQTNKIDLEPYKGLENEYRELVNTVNILSNALRDNELAISDYNKYVNNAVKEYNTKKSISQKRDYDEYVNSNKEKQRAEKEELDTKKIEDAKNINDSTNALKEYVKTLKEIERLSTKSYRSNGNEVVTELIKEEKNKNGKTKKVINAPNGSGENKNELSSLLDKLVKIQKEAKDAKKALVNLVDSDELKNISKKLGVDISSLTFNSLDVEKILDSVKPKINDIKADLTKTRNDYMQNTLTALSSQKEVFKNSKDPKSRSVIYQDKLSTYIKQLDEVSTKYDEISKKNIITKEDIESFDALKKSAEETATAIKNMSNMDKGVSGTTAGKWIRNISQYLEKNPKITAEAKQRLTEYLNILKDNGANANIREISAGFYKITNAERMAGREGKNLFSIIKDKALYGFAAQLGTFFSFYDIIRYGRQAVETIVNLDTALVDLRKTTTMSASELNQFYDESSEKAKKVGVTTAELIQQAANWSRLGFSDKDSATEMAMLSSKFAAISPDLDLDTATDGLVSSMKAFDIEVSDVQRDIMDNINRIGNTAATSNGEIVDMLTRSSAAMAAANNTIEETIALESAAVEITRNAETTGTAFKTIAMRLRGKIVASIYRNIYAVYA